MEAHHRRFARLVSREALDVEDLAEAALLVGTCVEPSLDIDFELGRLQQLAEEFEADEAASLAREMFGSGRFVGNVADYYDAHNSVLASVIDRGLGIPISLSVLFIDVGLRRGLSIYGVGMPGHFVARSQATFFDPYHGGIELDAADCQRLYSSLAGRELALPPGALEPTPPAEILQRMLWNLRSIADGRNDADMQFNVLGMLAECSETPLPVRMAWATALAERGQYGRAAAVIEALMPSAPEAARPRLMGLAQRWLARLN